MPKGAGGYTPFGTEHAKDSEAIDLKEFWHVHQDVPPEHPLFSAYGANVFPDEVPHFQPAMMRLYRDLEAAAQTLLEAIAIYLDLPERDLADMVVDGRSVLRIIHYPPLGKAPVPGAVRAAAHEDINLITLLPAATESGLELLDRDGSWHPVDGLEGEIVVDAGDMLSRHVNNVIPSTTHRVVNPDTDDVARYSMPFFCHPRPEVLLDAPAVAGGRRRASASSRSPPTTSSTSAWPRSAWPERPAPSWQASRDRSRRGGSSGGAPSWPPPPSTSPARATGAPASPPSPRRPASRPAACCTTSGRRRACWWPCSSSATGTRWPRFEAAPRATVADELDPWVDVATWNEDRAAVAALYTVLLAESIAQDHPARAFFLERNRGVVEVLAGIAAAGHRAGRAAGRPRRGHQGGRAPRPHRGAPPGVAPLRRPRPAWPRPCARPSTTSSG